MDRCVQMRSKYFKTKWNKMEKKMRMQVNKLKSKDIRRYFHRYVLSVEIYKNTRNTITVRFVKPTYRCFQFELTEWWCGNSELKPNLNLYVFFIYIKHTHTHKVKCKAIMEYCAACARYFRYYYYPKKRRKKRDDLIFWDPLMVMLTTNSSDWDERMKREMEKHTYIHICKVFNNIKAFLVKYLSPQTI